MFDPIIRTSTMRFRADVVALVGEEAAQSGEVVGSTQFHGNGALTAGEFADWIREGIEEWADSTDTIDVDRADQYPITFEINVTVEDFPA